MKFAKKLRIVFMIVAAAIFAVFFSACDFFSYERGDSPEEIDYQSKLLQKQEEYVAALKGLSSEDAYYDAERKVYVLCLLESVNEIKDCERLDLLDEVFEGRKAAILSIKTIARYEEEERLQAEELANAKANFIGKLNALSSEENYREAELTVYRFYLKSATDEINACEKQELLVEIFNTYREVIASVKTAAEYEQEEAAAFTAFCEEKKREVRNYLQLEDYREEQAEQITAFISEYEEKIGKATDYDVVENLVREYKIMVYAIKTDAELFAEELAEAIREAIADMETYVNIVDYRANEAEIVTTILNTFNGQISAAKTLEEVTELVAAYERMLDSVKTDAILYHEEKMQLVEEAYAELLGIVDLENADKEWAESYREYCNQVKEEMTALTTKEEVLVKLSEEKKVVYLAGAQANDPNALKNYQEILIDDINHYNDASRYREEQRRELLSIRSSFATEVIRISTYDETMELFEATLFSLDAVLTNDDLWQIEDDEFRSRLRELYGTAILEEPKSLIEANNYFELAEIIDYYAFYQLDGESFIRDTFRVKLNWQHRDAIWERNEVYWYCELLKSAVDIKAEFEENSNQFVITLIPYDFATISNVSQTQKIDRVKSAVEFDSDRSVQTVRSDDFDDFAYYGYGKSVTVWNSQQLWYALEHEYVPTCLDGSSAERILSETKKILRSIIREGMSDEEKIFEIYKWFGENVQFDYLHQNFDSSSDVNNLPNEKISALQSHFVEGVINDRLAVCIGYAKTYLLMLRIEGITAKLNIGRMPYLEGTNMIGSIANSFHVYVFIQLNSVWYYSDPEKSFTGADDQFIDYYYICLPKNSTGLYEVKNKDLQPGSDYSFYDNLTFRGEKLFVINKTELEALLSKYLSLGGGMQLSVLYDDTYENCYIDLVNFLAKIEDLKITRIKSYLGEIIIYI